MAVTKSINKERTPMAADNVQQNASGMDQPAHDRNYEGFLKVLKWSTIVVAIIAAGVVLLISS